MTGTVVDALQDATGELHAAAQLMQSLAGQVQANLTSTTLATTTIVNNFINRPPVLNVYCDPVNGNDNNDGSTIATAKKSLDAIIAGMGSNATNVLLFGDTTLLQRHDLYAPLYLLGAQQAANPAGYIPFGRTLSFLGTAQNSPSFTAGTFCSGLNLSGPSMRCSNINFALPDVPSDLNFRSHLTSQNTTSFSADTITLTASSPQAGSLLGSRLTATLTVAFGTGAAGHLFQGVAAAGNPNSNYYYTTNITSA